MSKNNIILIIAAGERVGASVASTFTKQGYKVALAARSISTAAPSDNLLTIKADLSDLSSISSIFKAVEQSWGAPNVVVFNGANRITTPPDDPLSALLEEVAASRRVGFDSAYLAAQHALQGFKSLPDSQPKAFIYTGNALSQIAIPGVMPFAIGKVSAAMMIEYAANAYGPLGFKFYFADERQPDGRPAALNLDGPAHAELYWQLANEKLQSPWLVTFVKGQGRQPFPGIDFNGNTREMHYSQLQSRST